MSYHTWSVDGYGICTDPIEVTTSAKKIMEFLSHAPEYEKKAKKWLKECEADMEDADDIIECLADEDTVCGIASIMAQVITEAEGIELIACDDFDCAKYLLYTPTYPWKLPEKEKGITEEKLNEIFTKYCNMLTDKIIEIDYRLVENGG